jgi:hypothetical protein
MLPVANVAPAACRVIYCLVLIADVAPELDIRGISFVPMECFG